MRAPEPDRLVVRATIMAMAQALEGACIQSRPSRVS
jgi:hypothetical protein